MCAMHRSGRSIPEHNNNQERETNIEKQIYLRFLNNSKIHPLDLREGEDYSFLKEATDNSLKDLHSFLNQIAVPATYNRYKTQLQAKELRTGKPQGLPCLTTKYEKWAYHYIKNKKGFLKAKIDRQFLIAGRLTDLFIERYPLSIEIAGTSHDNLDWKAQSDLNMINETRRLNITHLHIENEDVYRTLPQRLDSMLLKKTDTRTKRRALRRIYENEIKNWLQPLEAQNLLNNRKNLSDRPRIAKRFF
jgi:very-short-patch-repair endonuclease